MSAARTGEWHLLGYDTDPVPAEVSGLDEVIAHYKKLSDAMIRQAALLKRIGEGDESQFKGEAANALRKRAQESAEALRKSGVRYDDVRAALVAYQPDLETARSETWKALDDAVQAESARRAADGLPEDSEERPGRLDAARDDLAAAKLRAEGAVRDLGLAAERASQTVRRHWGEDGLNHTWQERVAYNFDKFLKGLVEILGYIGMVLAVLAMIFPGAGALAWIAIGVAAVALIGSIALAAQGKASWMNVILGAIGLFAAGVGLLVGRSIAASLRAARLNSLTPPKPLPKPPTNTNPPTTPTNVPPRPPTPTNTPANPPVTTKAPPTGAPAPNPPAVTVPPKPAPVPPAPWTVGGAFGLHGLSQVNSLALMGSTVKVAPWVYTAGPSSVITGLTTGFWGAVPPSDFPGADENDRRGEWTHLSDYEYNHLTSSTGKPIA